MARKPARHGWPGIEPGYTFRDTDLAGKPAARYHRVSSNPDETEQKSVGDQKTEDLVWVKRTGVVSGDSDSFEDDDRSASIFATTQRENFTRLRAAIEAGRYKVIWFWSTSRQTRGDVNIYELASASADHGVLWCMGGQLLNPANEDDLLQLGIHHLMDRQYSWRISKDGRRGQKSAAYAGKPVHRIIYGYRRVYDTSVHPPRFLRDEPDMEGDGADSPAAVVREIFTRVSAGDALSQIARSLEERGIRRPDKPRKYVDQPCAWTAGTVRWIAQNPSYIGRRIHQAESWRPEHRMAAIIDLPEGTQIMWEPLVTDEQFWQVQRILSDPERQKFRPGARTALLAGVMRCTACTRPMHATRKTVAGELYAYYRCKRGCTFIRMDFADRYVRNRIVGFLADRKVADHLRQARDHDDTAAQAARADAVRIAALLEQAEARGEDDSLDQDEAVYWARRAAALRKKLGEARELARPASLDPVLEDALGPDAAEKWRTYTDAVRQHIIKTAAAISVQPDGQRPRKSDEERRADAAARQRRHYARRHGKDVPRLPRPGPVPVDPGRIEWTWLAGPDSQMADA